MNTLGSIQGALQETLIEESRWLMVVEGLWATVVITVLSLLIGTAIGGGIYAMQCSRRRWVREVAHWWKVIVRGTPILVLMLIAFNVVLGGRHGMVAAVAAFAINFSNMSASLFQSSIEAVGRGQMDAGRALGLSNMQVMRWVVAPQAIHNALPAYKFQAVTLLKGTSVVGYVAIQDLTRATEVIRSSTGENLIALLVVTAIYFLLAWLLVKALDYIVKKTTSV